MGRKRIDANIAVGETMLDSGVTIYRSGDSLMFMLVEDREPKMAPTVKIEVGVDDVFTADDTELWFRVYCYQYKQKLYVVLLVGAGDTESGYIIKATRQEFSPSALGKLEQLVLTSSPVKRVRRAHPDLVVVKRNMKLYRPADDSEALELR